MTEDSEPSGDAKLLDDLEKAFNEQAAKPAYIPFYDAAQQLANSGRQRAAGRDGSHTPGCHSALGNAYNEIIERIISKQLRIFGKIIMNLKDMPILAGLDSASAGFRRPWIEVSGAGCLEDNYGVGPLVEIPAEQFRMKTAEEASAHPIQVDYPGCGMSIDLERPYILSQPALKDSSPLKTDLFFGPSQKLRWVHLQFLEDEFECLFLLQRRRLLEKRPDHAKHGTPIKPTLAWDVMNLHSDWSRKGIPASWDDKRKSKEVTDFFKTLLNQGKIDVDIYPFLDDLQGFTISGESVDRALVGGRNNKAGR